MKTEIEYVSAEHKVTTGMVILRHDNGDFIAKVPRDVGNLFAAAPAMLAALKAAVNAIDWNDEESHEALEQVQAAIAQAESL